ncbi:LysR substrate-binding domain-containing protein [Ochrobactrum vermis]
MGDSTTRPIMNFSGLSLRDLEYAVALADQRSFVRAAAHCGVSQPALSTQIRKLEAFLRITLFERTTRRVLVTPAGDAVVQQATRVLEEAAKLTRMSHGPILPFGGQLKIAAISTLGPYLFPRIFGPLRTLYPAIAIIPSEGLTHELVASLAKGTVDAVLLSLPVSDSSLDIAEIFEEPFVLACPQGHVAGLADGPDWSQLHDSDRLLLEEGHCLRDQALATCQLVAPPQRFATSLQTLKYMVAAGEGCTLLPVTALSELEMISYRPMPDPGYSRRVALAWRATDPRKDELLALSAHLTAIVEELDLATIPSLRK